MVARCFLLSTLAQFKNENELRKERGKKGFFFRFSGSWINQRIHKRLHQTVASSSSSFFSIPYSLKENRTVGLSFYSTALSRGFPFQLHAHTLTRTFPSSFVFFPPPVWLQKKIPHSIFLFDIRLFLRKKI